MIGAGTSRPRRRSRGLLACSCSVRPLHGGRSTTATSPTGGLSQTLAQSDNPSQPSRQTQDLIRTRTYSLPLSNIPQPSPSIHYPVPSIQLVADREESHATTELGAAQKDTARELSAKLSSLKSIVWVGLALFILGLLSLFWPPLKAIIGSVTTSAAVAAGGLALIVLPTLIAPAAAAPLLPRCTGLR